MDDFVFIRGLVLYLRVHRDVDKIPAGGICNMYYVQAQVV